MIRKNIVILLCVMLIALLVGCGKEEEVTSELSASEVESEVVSEEVSEPVSEEVVENTEPEVEIVNIDTTGVRPPDALLEYVKTLDKTVIVDYNFSESTEISIIPNGAKYTMEENEHDIYYLCIMSTAKDISEFKTDVNYISFKKSPLVDSTWNMHLETVGTDLEVSFTAVYEDGTEEDFTIYVTIGEDVSLSQEVEILNYDNYDAFIDYLKSFNQTIIADYHFTEKSEQAIIPNGAKYTLKGESDPAALLGGKTDGSVVYDLAVIPTGRKIKSITTNVDYISVIESDICFIIIETVGTDLEVSFTVNYEDGTSEDFTIYVTTVE